MMNKKTKPPHKAAAPYVISFIIAVVIASLLGYSFYRYKKAPKEVDKYSELHAYIVAKLANLENRMIALEDDLAALRSNFTETEYRLRRYDRKLWSGV